MILIKSIQVCICIISLAVFLWVGPVYGQGETCKNIFPVNHLTPTATETALKEGSQAPDFVLPSVAGDKITLSHYLGKKNVVISFVPAAWTPVCSYQWPVYDKAKDIFHDNDAILLGITVDNVPTLYAWTKEISISKDGMWFPVLSDFFPHGQVAQKYGVLRPEGFSERALFVIDKKGIIQFIDIHDINGRPPLLELREALEEIEK